jgi:large subunit ribosomal protein L6
MSRIGKQPITIPSGVTASLSGGVLSIKGPLGTLSRSFKSDINIVVEGNVINLTPTHQSVFTAALWGTYGSHVSNMIEGVTKGYEKKMILEGIGYKFNVSSNKIVMALGLSHPVEMVIPSDIKVTADKNLISVSGIDKEKVGEFAAKIRAHKVTEPYKGKGIRYEGEFVRRKQGKKTVG